MTKDEQIQMLKEKVRFYRYDYLTGLMQRQDFEHDFKQIFAKAQISDMVFYLAFHDITGLHERNRKFGYFSGDELILQVSNDIRMCEHPCSVYRLSGDEFVTIYKTKPESIEVPDTTSAIVSNYTFGSSKEMFDEVDKMVVDKKRELKRRREDND